MIKQNDRPTPFTHSPKAIPKMPNKTARNAPLAESTDEAMPVSAGGAAAGAFELPDEAAPPVGDPDGANEPLEVVEVTVPLPLVVSPDSVADSVEIGPDNALVGALTAPELGGSVVEGEAEDEGSLNGPACIRISSHCPPIHSS